MPEPNISYRCWGFQTDGSHSQQVTSMHEGVIRDRPALPAPSEHHSLVIHQPCFTAYCIRARDARSPRRRRGIAKVPLLFGVQGSITRMLSKDLIVICFGIVNRVVTISCLLRSNAEPRDVDFGARSMCSFLSISVGREGHD
ncbi:hypothetical protein FPOAC2_08510 [Fusarium poae]|jgi:hypothetical protein|uniref:hypothetical protein n=1 Tax=Fusarium poae TaxID=36050 RepID=UPI001CEAD77C|nr:hypothetical protein FPOAC1_008580 [Fusarium poae]KAG8669192.1 hypothetical protein FPOAC1_008580 [Fusarium poae]